MNQRAPIEAAEGAVQLIERLVPAIEQVDSSSGALGTAVTRTLTDLAQWIGAAPAPPAQRQGWLERLFEALQDDGYGYLDELGDQWAQLCASPPVASEWADRLLPLTRHTFEASGDGRFEYFQGTTPCLASLLAAGRFDELLDLLALKTPPFWPYQRYGVDALLAQGRRAEALRYAEASRGPGAYDDLGIDAKCEHILLDSGMAEEAYRRYGLRTHRRGTYLATYRAVQATYPDKDPATVLADLAAETPGEEGKWFAAAKSARCWDLALQFANSSSSDPKTLLRAAHDQLPTNPAFAYGAALAALRWLCAGYGYDITSGHVLDAFDLALTSGEAVATPTEATRAQVRSLVASYPGNPFVRDVLGSRLQPA